MNIAEMIEVFKVSCPSCHNLTLVDTLYQPVQESDIEHKWWEVWTKTIWHKESWDCDEMAFAEMVRIRRKFHQDVLAPAVGVVGGILSDIYQTPHAANIFVREDKSVGLWDYQSQKVFAVRPETDKIRWIII